MQLPLQTFTTLVANAAAAVQGSARQLVDLTIGSTLRAILEANASLALWMQWLILLVLRATRAATSTGPDLDTWVADFGLIRLPAIPATGQATFSRFAATSAALVPVGVTVRTGDGAQTFAVTADTSNPAFTPAQNGYALPPGTAAVTVPVTAILPGTAGNVRPNAVSLIGAALPGIDAVGNAAPFASGADAETDPTLRARFAMFFASRSRATAVAIAAAIAGVQQNLSYALNENTSPDGTFRPGCFVVTLDDGSGAPPAALIARVTTAIDAVRPLGSIFSVQPPTLVIANVTLTLLTNPAAPHAALVAQVTNAITASLAAMPIGSGFAFARLAQLAFNTNPDVYNILGATVNGGTADLLPGPSGVIRPGTIAVS